MPEAEDFVPTPALGSEPAAVPAKSARILFVDALRAIAIVQMIWWHSFDATSPASIRSAGWYPYLAYVAGLVSCEFFLVAGLSAAIVASRARSSSKDRVVRISSVVLLGYLLKLDALVFSPSVETLKYFFSVGVLEMIGVSLIAVTALAAGLRQRSEASNVFVFSAIASLFFLAAPAANRVSADGLLFPVLSYVTHSGGSQFAMFPWAGFIFAGFAVGRSSIPEGATTPVVKIARRLAIAAMFTTGLIALWKAAPFELVVAGDARSTDPAFSLERLAVVLWLALGLQGLLYSARSLPRFVGLLSSHALGLYATHIIIVYKIVPILISKPRLDLGIGGSAAYGFAMIPISVISLSVFLATIAFFRSIIDRLGPNSRGLLDAS